MTDQPQEPTQPTGPAADDEVPEHRVIVVGPDGRPVGEVVGGVVVEPGGEGGDGEGRSITDLVEHPAKVMRIGSMIKQLLDEVRSAPLDEAARVRLKEIHERSVHELEDGLAPELIEELDRLSLPFSDDATPSEAELRIAQAQLVGWLEGLFHGIQTTLFAQQMAARAQLEEMRRRAIAPGPGGVPGMVVGADEDAAPRRGSSGPYL
ncbi:MAG: bacterial proteasome activator family protein [Candidatus Nanopelagicales bacterium]